jgi:hypothetical protein
MHAGLVKLASLDEPVLAALVEQVVGRRRPRLELIRPRVSRASSFPSRSYLDSPFAHHASPDPFAHAGLRFDLLPSWQAFVTQSPGPPGSVTECPRPGGRGYPRAVGVPLAQRLAALSADPQKPFPPLTQRSKRPCAGAQSPPRRTPRCCFAGSRGRARARRDSASTRWEKRSWRGCMRGFCVWLVSTRTSLLACSHPRSLLPRPGSDLRMP